MLFIPITSIDELSDNFILKMSSFLYYKTQASAFTSKQHFLTNVPNYQDRYNMISQIVKIIPHKNNMT